MLTVKTSLRPSTIHGMGLFAEEKISKGTVIWKFDPKFDRLFDPTDVEKMDELKQKFLHHFAYLEKTIQKYVLSVDDTRFINHSMSPNIFDRGVPGEELCDSVACRDIEIGEEITVNYRLIDANDETSDEAYLIK